MKRYTGACWPAIVIILYASRCPASASPLVFIPLASLPPAPLAAGQVVAAADVLLQVFTKENW